MTENLWNEKEKNEERTHGVQSFFVRSPSIVGLEIKSAVKDVYVGKLYQYTAEVLMRNVVGDIGGIKKGVFSGKIKASISPEKNTNDHPVAITSTKYKVTKSEALNACPLPCKEPMAYFSFGDMEPGNLKFAVWDPVLKEYTLNVIGKCIFHDKEDVVDVTFLTNLGVGAVNLGIPTLRKADPIYEALESSDDVNTMTIGKKGKKAGTATDLRATYNIPDSPEASYGFVQVAKEHTVRMTNKENQKKFLLHQKLAVDLKPVGSGLNFIASVTNSKSVTKTVSYGDDPSILCAPCYADLDSDVVANNCESQMINADNIHLNIDFSLYLMIKIGTMSDKDTFWIPIEKLDWGLTLEAECKIPPCGVGGWDGELYVPYNADWNAPLITSNVRELKQDVNLNSPITWEGFVLREESESFLSEGKVPLTCTCSIVDTSPLMDDSGMIW